MMMDEGVKKIMANEYVPYKQMRPGSARSDIESKLRRNLQTIKQKIINN